MDQLHALQANAASDDDVDEEMADAVADAAAADANGGSALTVAYRPVEAAQEQRVSVLRTTARTLAQLCSVRFNSHLAQQGYAGRLLLNFRDGELQMEVQPTPDLAPASAHPAALPAAGVSAYASLCFMLALVESSDCPFCAMDEWHLAPDAATRALILDTVMSYAEEHSEQQFILITPHNIAAAVAANATVTVHALA